MADSTSERENNFLKSWTSAETVCGYDLLCVIYKQDTGLSHISPARRVIGYKSVTFLLCRQFEEVTHIHCELNSSDIFSEILISTVQVVEQDGYKCISCRSQ